MGQNSPNFGECGEYFVVYKPFFSCLFLKYSRLYVVVKSSKNRRFWGQTFYERELWKFVRSIFIYCALSSAKVWL